MPRLFLPAYSLMMRRADRIVAADADPEDDPKPISHQILGENAEAIAPAASTSTS